MASISRDQALLLSHADVRKAFLANNNTDHLLPRIPRIVVRGDSLQVTRIDTLATAGFVSSGGAVDNSATSYITTARKRFLRRIAVKVEVNADIAQIVSQINDVFDAQIQAKMVAVWNEVSEQLIYGDEVDPNPAGIATLAAEHPDGVLSLGTPLTLAAMDDMIKRVRPWGGNTPRFFVMNRGQYAKLTGLAHSSGFDLPFHPDPVLGEMVAHYMGVPILVSDWITDTESTNKTSVYLLILGERTGDALLGGLVWFYSAAIGEGIRADGPFRVSTTSDVLFTDLEINLGFQSLSTGSVLRLSNITP
jgi:hypothetical protein